MKYETVGRCLVLHLEEELDHHYAAKIVGETNLIMEKYPVKHILFDFERVNFMDSSGIGVFIGRSKTMQYRGGKIIASHLSRRVAMVFQSVGLQKIVEVKEACEKHE